MEATKARRTVQCMGLTLTPLAKERAYHTKIGGRFCWVSYEDGKWTVRMPKRGLLSTGRVQSTAVWRAINLLKKETK